jgi:transcriptional regulator with XRE-family HTH domain
MAVERTLVVPGDSSLAERLRLARVAARLSPEEMAAALGVSLRTWQRLEDGTREPRPGELLLIAERTNQDLSFFGASPDPEEAPILPRPVPLVNKGGGS